MTDHTDEASSDSRVDAVAIFVLILIAVSTAIFWVSHQ